MTRKSAPSNPANPTARLGRYGQDPAALIKMGERLLRRMVGRILACRYLQASLSLDPRMPLRGRCHYRTRTGLIVVKQFLKAWLWAQACRVAIATPMPPRPRPNTPTTNSEYGTDAITRKTSPLQSCALGVSSDDSVFAGLVAQGFRSKIRLWDAPKTKRGVSPKLTQFSSPILPEARAWLLADIGADCDALQRVAVPARTHETPPNLAPQGVQAGQAYMDLQTITAILDNPDKAIARIARRTRRINARRDAALCVYAKPPPRVTAPKSPTDKQLKRLGDDVESQNWLANLAALDGFAKQSRVGWGCMEKRSHPPPPPSLGRSSALSTKVGTGFVVSKCAKTNT